MKHVSSYDKEFGRSDVWLFWNNGENGKAIPVQVLRAPGI
jgi:hypothetical protein